MDNNITLEKQANLLTSGLGWLLKKSPYIAAPGVGYWATSKVGEGFANDEIRDNLKQISQKTALEYSKKLMDVPVHQRLAYLMMPGYFANSANQTAEARIPEMVINEYGKYKANH